MSERASKSNQWTTDREARKRNGRLIKNTPKWREAKKNIYENPLCVGRKLLDKFSALTWPLHWHHYHRSEYFPFFFLSLPLSVSSAISKLLTFSPIKLKECTGRAVASNSFLSIQVTCFMLLLSWLCMWVVHGQSMCFLFDTYYFWTHTYTFCPHDSLSKKKKIDKIGGLVSSTLHNQCHLNSLLFLHSQKRSFVIHISSKRSSENRTPRKLRRRWREWKRQSQGKSEYIENLRGRQNDKVWKRAIERDRDIGHRVLLTRVADAGRMRTTMPMTMMVMIMLAYLKFCERGHFKRREHFAHSLHFCIHLVITDAAFTKFTFFWCCPMCTLTISLLFSYSSFTMRKKKYQYLTSQTKYKTKSSSKILSSSFIGILVW